MLKGLSFNAIFTLWVMPCVLSQIIRNPVYIIRNAESVSGSQGVLSSIGLSRATNCLPELFADARYDIGLVISCKPDSASSTCFSAFSTAEPIATKLGLVVDTTCGPSESDLCAREVISTFGAKSSKGILIIWDEHHLKCVLRQFGLRNILDDKPDFVITLYNGIFASESSQNCPTVGHASSQTATLPGTLATTSSAAAESQSVDTVASSLLAFLYYTTTFYVPDPVITSTPPNIGRRTVMAKSKRVIEHRNFNSRF